MSAGRDKKARTKERMLQREKAQGKRADTREAMLIRRAAKRAKRAMFKVKNK